MLNSLLSAAAPVVPTEVADSSAKPLDRSTVPSTTSNSLREREVLDLVEQGEEELMREAASRAYKLKQHYNTRGRIELGISELSHLHAQLNSMTTQCTLIVGFALLPLQLRQLGRFAHFSAALASGV